MKYKSMATQKIACTLLLSVMLLGPVSFAQSSSKRVYYRYVNEQGIKVMNQVVPPQFAKNGYEIVTRTGYVIEVVPPAPKPEEVETARKKEFLKTKYLALVKRYSGVEDINAARQRKLDQINANIAIQKGNLTNINGQMDKLTARAANYERSGRQVPSKILGHLEELKSQYTAVEGQIEKRRSEVKKINKKYDLDIVLLQHGKSLLDSTIHIDEKLTQAGLLNDYKP